MTQADISFLSGGLVIAVVMLGIAAAAAHGTLPLNGISGIRVPPVTANEEAWRAGHRAAIPWAFAGLVVTVAFALLAVWRSDQSHWAAPAVFGSAMAFLIPEVAAAWVAAARHG